MVKFAVAATALAVLPFAARADTLAQRSSRSVTHDDKTAPCSSLPALGAGTPSLEGGVTGSFASGAASGGSSDPAVSCDGQEDRPRG